MTTKYINKTAQKTEAKTHAASAADSTAYQRLLLLQQLLLLLWVLPSIPMLLLQHTC